MGRSAQLLAAETAFFFELGEVVETGEKRKMMENDGK